jgi:hypothetical protein
MLPVRFVIPIEKMQGDVPEDTELLRSMAAQATRGVNPSKQHILVQV